MQKLKLMNAHNENYNGGIAFVYFESEKEAKLFNA